MTEFAGRDFNQDEFDRSDAEGKKRLADLCGQCGLTVFGDANVWKYGDVPVDLGTRVSVTLEVGKNKLALPSAVYFEAEMRGVSSTPPWIATESTKHPFKFRYDDPSVVGRKAEKPLALLQVSFYESNATIVLLDDAKNKDYWKTVNTTRGEDRLSRVPRHLAVLIHQGTDGKWRPCQYGCNPSEDDTDSQRIIKDIFGW